MKSGLEGRNNRRMFDFNTARLCVVSMKSGLEGRNNRTLLVFRSGVSMKSGLEGRNNSFNYLFERNAEKSQ